jgi:antitoxin Phd
MNAVWQVQEAKNRFSEVIELAMTEGPQVVTRHGRAVVRIVSVSDEGADSQPQDDGFAHFLLATPRVDGLTLPPRRSRKAPPVLGG